MDPKPEPSMLAKFHNQKEADFDPKTHVIYGAGDEGMIKNEELKNITNNNKEIGETGLLEKQIEDVLVLIDTAEIEDLYKEEKEQHVLMEKKKKYAKDKILEVLKNIEFYHSAIMALDNVKLEKDAFDQEIYVKKLIEADTYRKQRHDTLLLSVQSTIRFIAHNFSEISEEAIEKWEQGLEERNLPILHAKRVKFPENIICPDNINVHDRKQIAKWANQLWTSLGEFRKGLSA
jgi:hypothetical protein